MRLTRHTDYALRVLMYAGARDEKVSTIAEIAAAYGISRDHLMKIVQSLGKAGYLKTVRGRSGGLSLARPAQAINIGAVVRFTEGDFDLVDCGHCVIAPACGLTGVLREALEAFMDILDRYTLADLLLKRGDMIALFAQVPAGPPTETLAEAREVASHHAEPALTHLAPDTARQG